MKIAAALLATLLPIGTATSADLIDFGRAYYLPEPNGVNNLYIEVESRTRLSTGEEYLLLAPHPREQTFKDDGQIYTSMLATDGPSFITFMMETGGGQTITERRYARSGHDEYKHECGPSPYGGIQLQPKKLSSFSEITDTAGLRSAATAGKKLTAEVSYSVGGVEVTTDFPVRVMNDNPAPASSGKEWQIASSPIPVYVPEAGGCGSLRSGYVAFGNFTSTLQFVYLCDGPDGIQDYACTVNRQGKARLFASD